MFADAILGERPRVERPPQFRAVGLVVREQQLGPAVAVEPATAVVRFVELDQARRLAFAQFGLLDLLHLAAPSPRIAEPDGGKHVERRRLGTAVENCDTDRYVVRRGLGILHKDIEIPVFAEDPGIDQLVLRVQTAAPTVLLPDPLVWEFGLRILIQAFHVRVSRGVVQVEVAFLDVLAVVALGAGESEQAFLKERVAADPQRDGETDALVAVADPGQSILVPAIGSGAGVLMGEVVPNRAIGAVIFANRTPGALAEIRAPPVPMRAVKPVLFQS